MKDTGINPAVQEKIIGILKTLFPTAAIYLYGSRARGTHQSTSDVDIGIDAGKPVDDRTLYEANMIMEALVTPLVINVTDLQAVPDTMKRLVDKDKILWKA